MVRIGNLLTVFKEFTMTIKTFVSIILASILSLAMGTVSAGHCNTADGHSHQEEKKEDRNY